MRSMNRYWATLGPCATCATLPSDSTCPHLQNQFKQIPNLQTPLETLAPRVGQAHPLGRHLWPGDGRPHGALLARPRLLFRHVSEVKSATATRIPPMRRRPVPAARVAPSSPRRRTAPRAPAAGWCTTWCAWASSSSPRRATTRAIRQPPPNLTPNPPQLVAREGPSAAPGGGRCEIR